jgi:hypothetical protein
MHNNRSYTCNKANLERYLNRKQQNDDQIQTVQLAKKNKEKDESDNLIFLHLKKS